jgi:hypothetical protein
VSNSPLGPPLAQYASIAHVARVYDYLLGGKDNFAADRDAAEQAMRINPAVVPTAHANRAFLARATRYLTAEAGLRQFLDIGTGMPAGSNIHEVAQSVAPESRVVYVDHDPIVLSHARALLISGSEGRTDFIEADLRQVAGFFARLDLVEPGLVRVPEWRPALAIDAAAPAQMWAGVAIKP